MASGKKRRKRAAEADQTGPAKAASDEAAALAGSVGDAEEAAESNAASDSDSASDTESDAGPASDSDSDSDSDSTSESDSTSTPEPPSEPTSTWAFVSTGPHRIRGGALMGVGLLATFLMMANEGQLSHGPLLGLATMLLATFGLLDFLGIAIGRDPTATPIGKTVLGALAGEPWWLAPRVVAPIAAFIVIGGGLVLGYELLPYIILLALAVLVPAAMRRPGLLVFVITCAMYLPLLGTYALWDPWETHYGEVAREMLSRDDWISLWWAQENWFWSKPILIFWSEALSMGMFGVDFRPDAHPLHPEWALRLPVFLLGLSAILAVYASIARVFTKRAGVLAALVLATMPHFFLLTHQAITDIPFVANMTVAMSLLILALAAKSEREVRTYQVGPFVVSAHHAMLAMLFMVVVPQVLYLASRNVTLVEGFRFAWHGDEFMFGSAGNDGVNGNAPVRDVGPYATGLLGQPISQALWWASGLIAILFMLRKERRENALFMFAFYVFCGLGFMGKGIPGFALPGLIALFYLVATRRWSFLFDGRLRVGAGALVVAVTGLPWYVAMFLRHGPPFTDRLLIHDHINRLASGVHGDNGSIEYFIEQLGYSTFPWVALAPAALTAWLWIGSSSPLSAAGGARMGPYRDAEPAATVDDAQYHRRQTTILISVWFAAAFTLFSAMVTKFHHYIFPAVPAIAIAVGLVLDRLFGEEGKDHKTRVGVWALAALGALLAVVGAGGLYGDLRGIVPEDVAAEQMGDWVMTHGPSTALSTLAIVMACASLGAGAWLSRRRAEQPPPDAAARAQLAPFAVLLLAGAVVLAFVARDLAWVTDARPQGYERLIHLFVYNYGRPWPEQLDYRPILTGFGIAATAIVVLAASTVARPAASRALLALALLFTTWTINVYLVDLAPHWGQRELIDEYYAQRDNEHQSLVAWQMNWKGENFYTGNHVEVFVDLDNAKIREWITAHQGQKAFFILEHGRLGSFRGLVGAHEVRELTTKRDNNKFVLVEADL